MLKNLLKDRFQLEIHAETKELPVYILTVAKGGPKLQPATIEEDDCMKPPAAGMVACHQFNGGIGRGFRASAATVGEMLTFVESSTDRPLVDRTELSGAYAFETEGWAPMTARSGDSDMGAIRPRTAYDFHDNGASRIEVGARQGARGALVRRPFGTAD